MENLWLPAEKERVKFQNQDQWARRTRQRASEQSPSLGHPLFAALDIQKPGLNRHTESRRASSVDTLS